MSSLEIVALDIAGAEVFGADLSNPIGDEGDQIKAAFASFGLLVFRDQVLDEQDLVRLASTFGTAQAPTGPGRLGQWHAGETGREQPMTGTVTALRGRAEAPDIRFASTYVAYDYLASATRKALEGLFAQHVNGDGAEAIRHPVVIRHPLSGRKALFVNPATTVGIEGMTEDASLPLLNQLFEHGQNPECVSTVAWEPGTVVLWDSRALWRLESADTDADRFVTMEIAGTALAPAVPQDPADPSLVQRAGATLAGGIITAAMTGIAEVIEPERARPDVEIVAEAPDREPLDDGLDFGGLPPLE